MSPRLIAVLVAAGSATSSLFAVSSTPATSVAETTGFLHATRHLPASTSLDQLELYAMTVPATSAFDAQAALSVEIERLYTHAKTLASGPERRAFETRIYHFEKRLRPLMSAFDAEAWKALRADVRAEWISIQQGATDHNALAAK
jgi:hypothetical protein